MAVDAAHGSGLPSAVNGSHLSEVFNAGQVIADTSIPVTPESQTTPSSGSIPTAKL